jgi:hypothetical protein
MKLTDDPTLLSRFTRDDVARYRDPADMPVLTDDPSLLALEHVHYGEDLAAITRLVEALRPALGGQMLLLCFNSDALASQVVLLLDRLRIRFRPGGPARPVAPYWRTNDAARDTIRELWAADGMNFGTVFEVEDYQYLMQVIAETRALPGDYVEIGVSRASSARIALHFMRKLGIARRCFFLDTFDGFNYPEAFASADCYWRGDGTTWGQEQRAAAAIAPYADPDAGRPVRVIRANVMAGPLPDEIGAIAVANIDVDMLGAVRAAMLQVHPRLVRGGVMVLEDAGHTPLLYGARAAVDEFAAQHGHRYFKLHLSSGQVLFIKQ